MMTPTHIHANWPVRGVFAIRAMSLVNPSIPPDFCIIPTAPLKNTVKRITETFPPSANASTRATLTVARNPSAKLPVTMQRPNQIPVKRLSSTIWVVMARMRIQMRGMSETPAPYTWKVVSEAASLSSSDKIHSMLLVPLLLGWNDPHSNDVGSSRSVSPMSTSPVSTNSPLRRRDHITMVSVELLPVYSHSTPFISTVVTSFVKTVTMSVIPVVLSVMTSAVSSPDMIS
mmetsp:Transcript_8751/g.21977  ORF Transcript_8751/g.21977 Transcript_8751/m.21977 type:complete len:230 (+) Transcript_8751:1902-2591(+)